MTEKHPDRAPLSPRRQREEAAAFIDDWASWTHFVTATYPRERSSPGLEFDYRRFRELLAAMGGDAHVPIALAVGPQQRGVPHMHMLFAMPAEYRGNAARHMRRHWYRLTGGTAQVRRYDPTRRAGHYLAGHYAWRLDYACPLLGDCRRGTCALVCAPLSLT